MVNELGLFESTEIMPLDFSLWGWMKCEVCKRNEHTGGELLARVLDNAARIRKCGDNLWQTTLDVLTGVAKCIQVDGGVSENLLWPLTNLLLLVF
jgi:hypothetical protein